MSGLDIGIPRTPVLEGSGSFRGLLGLRGFRIPSVRGFANALAHIGITCFAYPLLVLLAWRIAKKNQDSVSLAVGDMPRTVLASH